jgi:hypothetical protein
LVSKGFLSILSDFVKKKSMHIALTALRDGVAVAQCCNGVWGCGGRGSPRRTRHVEGLAPD